MQRIRGPFAVLRGARRLGASCILVLFALATPGAWAGPVMEWGTYLGGSQDDEAKSVAVDSEGNVYVAGDTGSAGLPSWVQGGGVGTVTTHHGGTVDGFVAKFGPDGAHIWSTYVGGSGWDDIRSIVIASVGGEDVIYIGGWTTSTDWIAGGHDTTPNGGWDGFVAKMNASGGVVWSTYLGGDDMDIVNAITVDPTSGDLVVVGHTKSSGWLAAGWDDSYNGDTDGFVAKLRSSNGQMMWGSYIGGAARDYAYCVAVGASGNVFVGGDTSSAGWALDGWDTSYGGSSDGFLVRFNSSGAHWWSTYLGGASTDLVEGLALDGDENIYVAGLTGSDPWLTGGWNTTQGGSIDAFVALFTMQGAHVRGGLLGGSGIEYGKAIALDSVGNVYLSGITRSYTDVASGGWDMEYAGGTDGFVAAISPDLQSLRWASYIGDTNQEYGNAVAVAPSGAVYVGSRTNSSGWLAGGWDSTYGGSGGNAIGDGYLLKVGPTTGSVTVTISPALANVAGARWRLDGAAGWRSSADSDATAIVGPRTIEFKEIGGWTKPADIELTLNMDQHLSYSRSYARNGWLRVSILPSEAVAAGAQWRRKGTSQWLDSGASENVPPTEHAIEFKPVSGWITPGDRSALVQGDVTSDVEETYVSLGVRRPGAWLVR